jgi:hypothetical protein
MKKKLPLLLPLFQFGLGLVLGLWGAGRAKEALRGSVVYDYVPAPDLFSHLINLPATLLTAAIFRRWTFQIGPTFSWVTFSVYLFFIAVLWYLVGLRIVKYESLSPHVLKRSFSHLGMFIAGLVFLMGIILFHSPLGYLVSLSALLWSLAVVFLSRRPVAPGIEERQNVS